MQLVLGHGGVVGHLRERVLHREFPQFERAFRPEQVGQSFPQFPHGGEFGETSSEVDFRVR